MDFNRSLEPQDTSTGAAPARPAAAVAWVVGQVGDGAGWQTLAPGGSLVLAEQPGSGRVEQIEIRLRGASAGALRSHLILQWVSSPVPEANEAGVRRRMIDGAVPLSLLCGESGGAAARMLPTPGGGAALAEAAMAVGGEQRLLLRLPLPYRDGVQLRLSSSAGSGLEQPACEIQWRVQGYAAAPPADNRYLRASYLVTVPPAEGSARLTSASTVEHLVFESHGCGQVIGLIAPGAADPASVAAWTLTWYLDGDERLLSIEETTGVQLFPPGGAPAAAACLPAFAEYIKCTLRWTAAPAPGAFAGLLLFALVEDRPIA